MAVYEVSVMAPAASSRANLKNGKWQHYEKIVYIMLWVGFFADSAGNVGLAAAGYYLLLAGLLRRIGAGNINSDGVFGPGRDFCLREICTEDNRGDGEK